MCAAAVQEVIKKGWEKEVLNIALLFLSNKGKEP